MTLQRVLVRSQHHTNHSSRSNSASIHSINNTAGTVHTFSHVQPYGSIVQGTSSFPTLHHSHAAHPPPRLPRILPPLTALPILCCHPRLFAFGTCRAQYTLTTTEQVFFNYTLTSPTPPSPPCITLDQRSTCHPHRHHSLLLPHRQLIHPHHTIHSLHDVRHRP
jgi:hypothetical protein